MTIRFHIEFPLVVCYTPECIILNPLEGIGNAVRPVEGREGVSTCLARVRVALFQKE